MVAGHYRIPEVTIYFGNKILRGNRSTKNSTGKIVAFESPNFGPLGEVGVNFDIKWHKVLRNNFEGDLRIFTKMSSEVSVIKIQPCINFKVLESILRESRAVIIEAYGMGNIPTLNTDLMNSILRAIKNGVILVIKTQCSEGGVNDLYETGRVLVEQGAVLGHDMTLECIIAKLSYLIGNGFSNDKIKKMMMQIGRAHV